MNVTPEIIQGAVAALGFLGGLLTLGWRLSLKAHASLEAQKSILKAVDTLRAQLVGSARKFDSRLAQFAQDVDGIKRELATLAVVIHEREKDTSRIEGQLEQLGTMLVKNVAALQGNLASTDALWRALAKLHPEHVPRRASDRG
jgi:septal ring factor EnvC (AmiA/AmiB activator)